MKVKEITISYSEARSARFQKVDHNVSITVEIGEGETVRDVINKYRPTLVDTVSDLTTQRLQVLVNDAEANDNGRRY